MFILLLLRFHILTKISSSAVDFWINEVVTKEKVRSLMSPLCSHAPKYSFGGDSSNFSVVLFAFV